MTVRLTPAAARDLDQLLTEAVQQHGTTRAERTKIAWDEAFVFLNEVPTGGSAFGGVRTGLRRHVVRPYAAYYGVRDGVVLVRRILHVRQDPQRHL